MPAGKINEVLIKSRLLVNAADGAVESTLQGAGLDQLYLYQAASHVASGELEIILGEFEADPSPVYNSASQGQYAPQKVKAVVDYAQPGLRR
jgi:hypothetical protein